MMADAILDCSTLESAVDSLARLLDRSQDTLRLKLSSIDLVWIGSRVAPEDQLLQALGFQRESELPVPNGIRWFHVTRVPEDTTFEEGLQPTDEVLSKLWVLLESLAARWSSPAEWAEFRLAFGRGGRHFSDQFRRKAGLPGWGGPFAFLVRDAALGRCGDHKDFTRIPEVLEDVCGDYEDRMGHSLRQAYEHATRPCVVVFTTRGGRYGAVRAALNYAHRMICGLDHGVECNTCFAGNGQAVPRAWIDRIEWL